jgi:hypothetical protein
VFTWIVRMLLFRRFGATRAFVVVGLLNFLRRRLGRRKAAGVYTPGVAQPVATTTSGTPVYQPSQGSSQTAQRRPR